jgi:arsenite-transporting ATPase
MVAIPEKMVVEETKRSYMYLNLYNFNVDAIFINRILPVDINLSFFDEWLMLQAEYIKELETIFGSIPIHHVKWYDIEITGMKALDLIVKDALAKDNILDIQTTIRNEEYEKTDQGYQLKVYLPCASKEDLMIHETGMDIVIRIGNYKRSIPLPNALRKYRVDGAKIIDQFLKIQFVPEKGDLAHE